MAFNSCRRMQKLPERRELHKLFAIWQTPQITPSNRTTSYHLKCFTGEELHSPLHLKSIHYEYKKCNMVRYKPI
jgi:hypothetical protein